MKVGKIRTQTRRDDYRTSTYGIASYGENNDYPEKIRLVIAGSPSASGCLKIAQKFIFGEGFADKTLAYYFVNDNDNANQLLRKVVDDYRPNGGFAVHINYNALLQPVEFQHVPFEHCRIAVDSDGIPTGKIKVHPNWTQSNKLLKFNRNDIQEFDVFTDDTELMLQQIEEAEGIENWNGHILYFSDDGKLVYPLSPYDSCVTDMSTEEGVSTVLHRNARHNFLPAGMLVRKKPNYATSAGNDEANNDTDDGLESEILEWQGDERAGKIIVVTCEFDELEPKFVPFPIHNFDKMFEKTTDFIEANIGKVFMQPPILRGIDVGAGFGADLMKNAYDAYNSQVEGERKVVEEELMKLFDLLPTRFTDYTIKPLDYIKNEKLDQ